MNGLSLKFQDETRVFGPDGKVSVLENGQPVPKGTWRSQALATEPKDNQIRYDISGQAQPPVPVKYQFNTQNQLVAVIPAEANGGADSDPFTFLGSIQVDDANDIVYQLITPEGASMSTQRHALRRTAFWFESQPRDRSDWWRIRRDQRR